MSKYVALFSSKGYAIGENFAQWLAHKLNTIRNADKIVVLGEDGNVVQVGTHDELIASSGMYQHLWSAREAAQGWSLI